MFGGGTEYKKERVIRKKKEQKKKELQIERTLYLLFYLYILKKR